MAGPNLPTNIDAVYGDSASDPSVKIHQQQHDIIHRFLNLFDQATPNVGDVWQWTGSMWAPAAPAASSGGDGGGVVIPPPPPPTDTVGPTAYTASPRTPDTGDTVIYVDPTSASGTADGSSANPLKTIGALNSASKPAGTVIYLKRGTTLTGKINMTASGTQTKPITLTAYGTGAQPVVNGNQVVDTCLSITGTWVDVVGIYLTNGSYSSAYLGGANSKIRGCTITGSSTGVQLQNCANAKVMGCQVVDNNRMSVNTQTPTNDDSGAFGLLLNTGADDCEIGFNSISGHLATSYDYGYDGCAVEIYGGKRANVHHNIAAGNETFAELGNATSADNIFTYNVVTAPSYSAAKALVTRGSQDTFGPVLGTVFSHNSVYLPGSAAVGVIAYANSGQNIISVSYNAIKVGGNWAYDDSGTKAESNNVFSGPVRGGVSGSSVLADPKFVSTTDLHLQTGSPAVAKGAGAYDTTTAADPLPVGVPGTWSLIFRDEFDGASLDTSKWNALNKSQNNVTTSPANVSVANGVVTLILSDASTGAEISTSTLDGQGTAGFEVLPGDYTEARCYFPGDTGDPIWNWPAWWQSDARGTWPVNGEIDTAEGLSGRLTANYHSGTVPNQDTGVNNSGPIGAPTQWTNGWHTYGAHRKASSVDYYWDGALVRTVPSSDAGGGHTLILNIGKSNSRTLHTGDSGGLKCDYVRAWRGGSGGGGTTGSITAMGNPAVSEVASSSGSITATMPTGTVSGEILIATVSCTIGDVVPPTGWTLIPGTQSKGGDTAGLSTQGYYRVATGTTAATYVWTGVGTSRASVLVQRFSGVNTTTPFDVTSSSGHTPDSQTGVSYAPPAITTVTAGALIVTGAAVNAASAATLVTPAGYTARGASTGTGRGAALASAVQATAGSSGTVTWNITPTTTSLQVNAWIGALRPA